MGYRPGDLVPSLAALIPQTPQNKDKKASQMPWVKASEDFFDTWKKLKPCMFKYEEFLQAHKGSGTDLGKGFLHDLKVVQNAQQGKVASKEVEQLLGEFYLAVALQLRPQEVEASGSDNQALLQLANRCAQEDFEPFIDQARNLVSDYDHDLHQALEETSPLYEVENGEGLFWHANFDAAAPAPFQHYLTSVGHGSGQAHVASRGHISPDEVSTIVAETKKGLLDVSNVSYEPARRAAAAVYEQWLQASSMPVKASIIKALMQHGLIVSKDILDDKLLPKDIDVDAA